MNKQETQFLATFLIVFAAICIAAGCKFGWHDLVSFAQMFGGGGVGILTGQKLQQLNADNATLNVSPAPKQ